eukprot:1189284-Prorocentrum_minimum.AAC.3
MQKVKGFRVFATQAMGREEQTEEKRKKAHAKLKKLMSGELTPLSEVAKPHAPSSLARYR